MSSVGPWIWPASVLSPQLLGSALQVFNTHTQELTLHSLCLYHTVFPTVICCWAPVPNRTVPFTKEKKKYFLENVSSFLVRAFLSYWIISLGLNFLTCIMGITEMWKKKHNIAKAFRSECVTGWELCQGKVFSFCFPLVSINHLTLSNKTKFLIYFIAKIMMTYYVSTLDLDRKWFSLVYCLAVHR